ncbi:MAG: hypothetical protein ACRC35_03635 [Angustibacter sp.]
MRGAVRVRAAFTEVRGRGLVLGPPKSRAGMRTVSLPATVTADLVAHLDRYVDVDPDALVFTGPKGAPIRRGNFNPLVRWGEAVAAAGVPGCGSTTCGTPATRWPRRPGSAPGT